jgi:hypothetical protein
MKYEQIEAPRAVKAGQLPICDALGTISLLPLAKPTEPKALLRQLMLDNWTPAILVEDATGDEHPIPQSFWQSSLSGQAFRGPMIEFPVRMHGLERRLVGHIVFKTAIVRRAIASLLKQPELLPEVVAALNDPDRKRMVVTGIQQGKEATFDEAVKRWQASGTAALSIEKTMFTAKIPTPAERVARQAAMQRAGGVFAAELKATPTLSGGGRASKPSSAKVAIDGIAKLLERQPEPMRRAVSGNDKTAMKKWITDFLKQRLSDPRADLLSEPKLRDVASKKYGSEIPRRAFHDALAAKAFEGLRRQKGETDLKLRKG